MTRNAEHEDFLAQAIETLNESDRLWDERPTDEWSEFNQVSHHRQRAAALAAMDSARSMRRIAELVANALSLPAKGV